MHVIVSRDREMQKMKKGTVFEVLLHIQEESDEEYVLVNHYSGGGMLMMPDDVILYQKEGFNIEEIANCSWLRIYAPDEISDAKFYEIKSNEAATHVLLSDLEFIN